MSAFFFDATPPARIRLHRERDLVVSQDVDIAVPIDRHAAFKLRLLEARGLACSAEEPSVWLPTEACLLEVNFTGWDAHGTRAGAGAPDLATSSLLLVIEAFDDGLLSDSPNRPP